MSASDLAALLARRWQEEPSPHPVVDYRSLELADSEWGRCEPLLFEAAQGLEIDPDLVALWRERYLYTAIQNRVNARELAEVLRQLAGMDVIVLKGMALSVDVYRNLALRPVQDIDLLVAPEEARACVNKIEQLGYRRISREARPGLAYAFENEAGMAKVSPPHTAVDIHWHLFDSPHHQHHIDLSWFWNTARWVDAEGLSVCVLGPEAQLIHLCGHLALHHPTPPGGDLAPMMLWLADIGEVIYRYGDEMDWDAVLIKAQEYDLVLPLQAVIGHVRDLWPFIIANELWERIAALPPTRTEQRVYKWLTSEHRPVIHRFATDLAMMPTWSLRSRYAAQSVFPSAEYMQWRYDIDQRWMAPAYYPYRWWVGLTGVWKDHN